MYLVSVPYKAIVDADGFPVRTPDVPDGWAWEQAASELDTGWFVKKNQERALITILEPRATVETWMNESQGGIYYAKDLGDALDQVRQAARNDDGARIEFSKERALQARAVWKPVEDAAKIRGAARMVWWLLFHVGAYAAARYLNLLPEHVALAITAGTAVMQEDFTALTTGFPSAGGQEMHGLTPAVLGSGTFQNKGNVASEANSGTGVVGVGLQNGFYGPSRDSSVAGNVYVMLTYEQGSAWGDQYVETHDGWSSLGRTGFGVRVSGTGSGLNCYYNRFNTNSIYRLSSGSSTTIASSITYTRNPTTQRTMIRMEAVGSNIYLYTGTYDTTPTLDASPSDSTHSTGFPGFACYNFVGGKDGAALGYTHEAGTISAGGGAPIPAFMRYFRNRRS